jgi:transaldolase
MTTDIDKSAAQTATPLAELSAQGVSIWLDDLSRQRMNSGSLQKLIDAQHVVGVTTNPSIFQKALSEGDAYDEQMRALAMDGADVARTVRTVTADDVRRACDILRPVYDATEGMDGCVSYEVDPRKAHDTEGTIAEAKDLWALVDRPNLYIKIPATLAGLPAITEVLADGISVNVTLIFSLERYRAVMDAHASGLEQALEHGHELGPIASVASFFVSRVDVEIDSRLDAMMDGEHGAEAKRLRGQAAIANARLAYEAFEAFTATDRWKALAAQGAHPQRPLWASTGVKDKAYEDTRYVTELVAPGTVNTMPEDTLTATADHGVIRGDTVRGTYDEARRVLADLEAIGVGYDDVIEVLEREGVEKFEKSWLQLLGAVDEELTRLSGPEGATVDKESGGSA